MRPREPYKLCPRALCSGSMYFESSLSRWFCPKCEHEILVAPPITVAAIRKAIEEDFDDGEDTPIELEIKRGDWDRLGDELGIKRSARKVTSRLIKTRAGYLTLKLEGT